jgi:6-phosphogluconolactonase (cycloisomerase 2 family)
MTFQGSLKVDGGPRHMVINKEGTFGWILTEILSCMIQPVTIDRQTGKLTYSGKPVAVTQANQAAGAGAEILLSRDERMIVASNRQTEGHQNDYLTTFEVDSGRLTEPTTYDTNGQVIRGMAFDKDSTLLVFGHEANGTIGMFGRDLGTNKLTLLTPHMLNLTAAAKIKSPASPSSFVFRD